ncbi:MAG: hypothetical protein IKB64_06510 [Paludibacteraceae bacterium]|nr:hypothetical protein [Paludibacteraceae bacterium]
MFALADCNNFFVSCERVFRPDLQGKPVIVLSNNDGCAVARSNEAKALGIKMGDPFFKIRDIVEKHKVAVFSGNMALYGDMSQRVRWVLEDFSPAIEVYSIDEAFLLELHNFGVGFVLVAPQGNSGQLLTGHTGFSGLHGLPFADALFPENPGSGFVTGVGRPDIGGNVVFLSHHYSSVLYCPTSITRRALNSL